MTNNSPNPVDGDVQWLNVRGRFTPERFLSECLKPEEISGEKQRARIEELMMWFDRYYLASANPKWLRGHVAEICYYIMAKGEATPPGAKTERVELPEPYDDGHGNLWLPQNAVISAVKNAGGEVKS
ncbi:hypothetical protein [Pantoea phage PA-1]